MAHRPKLFVSGDVHEITFRTEEGLPLVPTPYMKVILYGITAQAFALYQARLAAKQVMSNHMHLLIKVVNPEHVDDVVAYIKRESAHAINNLLGRRRHTVWQEGYDCPKIADLDTYVRRIVYYYTNPAAEDLTSSIDDYPNLNTWGSILKDDFVLKGRRIPREVIPALPKRTLSFNEQERLAAQLLEHALPEVAIPVEPFEIAATFDDTIGTDRERLRRRIIREVRAREAELNAKRRGPVVGAHALRLQSIRTPHTPKKFGKKMWVLGASKEIRLPIINWLKEQYALRRELKRLHGPIEFFKYLPPGFFLPGGRIRANLNPAFAPT